MRAACVWKLNVLLHNDYRNAHGLVCSYYDLNDHLMELRSHMKRYNLGSLLM